MNISKTLIDATDPETSGLDTSSIVMSGNGCTGDVFAVDQLATASIAAAVTAIARYADASDIRIDRRLASLWFSQSIHPRGWHLPETWDDIAGNYAAKDGWVRLHTNALAHRAAVLRVLNGASDKKTAQKQVQAWDAEDLQEAVVAEGGASAMMLSCEDWVNHPQGKAVSQEPLVKWSVFEGGSNHQIENPRRPLAGLKVLDLTRIIAGPVATRFLGLFGADVLRIDPPGWDELGSIADLTPGKQCATLDIKSSAGRARLRDLISQAHVLVHGYRADALERLGFGEDERRSLNPGLIDVSHNAYGWTGPWRNRRGFDSVVQMSCGIAHLGMVKAGAKNPKPMTVQALDHATGYLIAASALNGLRHLRDHGKASSARLSLAATAEFLKKQRRQNWQPAIGVADESEMNPLVEATDWGPANRLILPFNVANLDAFWQTPAARLHSAEPRFRDVT